MADLWHRGFPLTCLCRDYSQAINYLDSVRAYGDQQIYRFCSTESGGPANRFTKCSIRTISNLCDRLVFYVYDDLPSCQVRRSVVEEVKMYSNLTQARANGLIIPRELVTVLGQFQTTQSELYTIQKLLNYELPLWEREVKERFSGGQANAASATTPPPIKVHLGCFKSGGDDLGLCLDWPHEMDSGRRRGGRYPKKVRLEACRRHKVAKKFGGGKE
ncbi:hypothetical protein DL95DRAFT_414326 [Leptodontidium sp. 2 PMI_412]|nr:hypothetical protein DL95DRAFT_414326 [Leptodontidium sp. 2 PMI_412]